MLDFMTIMAAVRFRAASRESEVAPFALSN